MVDDADVIVIGAGIAGLAAAIRLEERGLVVRVLEARELGGELVHGDAKSLEALARSFAVPLVDVSGAHWRSGPHGLGKSKAFENAIEDVVSRVAKRMRDGADASFGSVALAMKIAIGDVAKIVLHFREPFFLDPKVVRVAKGEKLHEMSFLHPNGGDVQAFWTSHPIAHGALESGFAAADEITKRGR